MESKEINIHKFSKSDIHEIIKNHLIDRHGANFQSGTVEVEWGEFLPDPILTFIITEEK